jgi:hypothetical protein
MKVCPNCSAENSDVANFCKLCRTSLTIVPPVGNQPVQPPVPHGGTYRGPAFLQPQSLNPLQNNPPPPSHAPLHTTINPAQPQPMPVAQNQPYLQPTMINQAQPFAQTGIRGFISNVKGRSRNWSLWHGKVIAEGYLSAVDPVRDLPVPFDLGWTMFVLSMVLVALGLLAATAMMALAVAIVLLILGIGGLCIAPILLPMIGAILFPLYNTLRGNKKAPMVEFRVEDELTGQPVSIVMFLRHGSSSVRLGDRVRVYGSRQWFTSLLRANHVKVVETNRQAANYSIGGIRPWPFFIGLISLALVLYGYWWLFS